MVRHSFLTELGLHTEFSQKKEQAAANADGGPKKKKVTAAQLRVQKGTVILNQVPCYIVICHAPFVFQVANVSAYRSLRAFSWRHHAHAFPKPGRHPQLLAGNRAGRRNVQDWGV